MKKLKPEIKLIIWIITFCSATIFTGIFINIDAWWVYIILFGDVIIGLNFLKCLAEYANTNNIKYRNRL